MGSLKLGAHIVLPRELSVIDRLAEAKAAAAAEGEDKREW